VRAVAGRQLDDLPVDQLAATAEARPAPEILGGKLGLQEHGVDFLSESPVTISS
jgi:hypothetical protein